jgi:hypothetical protein
MTPQQLTSEPFIAGGCTSDRAVVEAHASPMRLPSIVLNCDFVAGESQV